MCDLILALRWGIGFAAAWKELNRRGSGSNNRCCVSLLPLLLIDPLMLCCCCCQCCWSGTALLIRIIVVSTRGLTWTRMINRWLIRSAINDWSASIRIVGFAAAAISLSSIANADAVAIDRSTTVVAVVGIQNSEHENNDKSGDWSIDRSFHCYCYCCCWLSIACRRSTIIPLLLLLLQSASIASAVAADRSTVVVAVVAAIDPEFGTRKLWWIDRSIDRSFIPLLLVLLLQSEKRIGVPPLLRTESNTRLHHCKQFAHSQAFVGSIIILIVKLVGSAIVKLVGSIDLWNNFLRCSTYWFYRGGYERAKNKGICMCEYCGIWPADQYSTSKRPRTVLFARSWYK